MPRRRSKKKLTTQEFFRGVAYDPDHVWTRPSRAFAKMTFNVGYIGLVACGTVALTAASILISFNLPNDNGLPSPPAPESSIVVVSMDANAKHNIYDPALLSRNETNAHFIDGLITNDPQLASITESFIHITGSDPNFASSQVMRNDPDLVIVHRSSFETDSTDDANDQKLTRFLSNMAGKKAEFLIYSRMSGTDSTYARSLAHTTRIENERIHVYRFLPGYPFADNSNQVVPFKNHIKEIAESLISRREQTNDVETDTN